MTTAQEWLENVRGLDIELTTRAGVKCGPSQVFGGKEAVGIPYVQNGSLLGYKVRVAGPRPEKGRSYSWSPNGLSVTLWNVDCLYDETLHGQPVIVTEGEFDGLAVIECGFPRTVSPPHGAQSGERYVYDHATAIRKSPCVILAGDNDPEGWKFIRAAGAALDGHDVRFVRWPDDCKDANEVLAKHGAKAVVEAINGAKPFCPDEPAGGMLSGFKDAPPPPSGAIYRTGDRTADLAICFHSGFPTVVTGAPQTGKSTFITWALWMAGRAHGVRNAVCMRETPWPYLREHLVKLETGGMSFNDLDRLAQDKMVEKLDANWRLMHHRDLDDVAADISWLKKMMQVAAVRDGCRIVTFDPWNEFDHLAERGEALTDYTNRALAYLRQWAERFDVAICILAHPTKMQREAGGKVYPPTGYDIAGSAAWFNKAAVGVTVHRETPEDGSEFTRLINWKSKFQQLYRIRNGSVKMEFDENKMVYRRLMGGS